MIESVPVTVADPVGEEGAVVDGALVTTARGVVGGVADEEAIRDESRGGLAVNAAAGLFAQAIPGSASRAVADGEAGEDRIVGEVNATDGGIVIGRTGHLVTLDSCGARAVDAFNGDGLCTRDAIAERAVNDSSAGLIDAVGYYDRRAGVSRIDGILNVGSCGGPREVGRGRGRAVWGDVMDGLNQDVDGVRGAGAGRVGVIVSGKDDLIRAVRTPGMRSEQMIGFCCAVAKIPD